MNNRLQFIHCDTLFSTRDEAKAYVTGGDLISITRPALYAEPMVLKYGDENNPNVILAIGSVGDGVTQSTNNKVFFIDFAEISESIKAIVDENKNKFDELTNLKEILEKLITSCGVNEDGTYAVDSEDEILNSAVSLTNADKLLSDAIQSNVQKLQDEITEINAKLNLEVENTPTIIHTLSKQDSGMTLSSEINLAPYRTVGSHNWNNILLRQADGLFANVRLFYNEEDNKVYFGVNDDEQVIELPKDVKLESGEYQTETEELVFKMSDGSEVKVNVSRLIGEWKVQGEDSKTPIVLKKETIKNTEDFRNGDENQDILTADVRIAGVDKYTGVPFNILEKYEGDTLYVKGTADNIIYFNSDGTTTTLQKAIQGISCEISTRDENIITKKEDGIYAKASLSYNEATNSLTFDNGLEQKIIQLNAGGVVERAYYNDTTESIIIVFELANGGESTVEVPVGKLIEEWDVENNFHTVTLVRRRQTGSGKDSLSADVNISDNDDNILIVSNHSLYVKGTADNIKYGNSTVQAELDKLEGGEDVNGSLKNLIKAEKDERIAADNALQQAIDNESERAKEAEHKNTIAISDLTNTVSGNTTDISSLKSLVSANTENIETVKNNLLILQTNYDTFTASTNNTIGEVETNISELATRVDIAESDIDKVESDLNGTKESLSKEIEDRKNADIAINSSISGLTNDIKSNAEKIADVDSNLKTLSSGFTAFETSALETHRQLANSINKINESVSGTTAQIESLTTDFNSFKTTASNVHSQLSNKVTDLENSTGNINNALTKLNSDITAEVNRATQRENEIEKKLQEHIDNTTSSIEGDVVSLKSDVEALKQKDITLESDIKTISGSVISETERATNVESELKSAIESNDNDIAAISGTVLQNTSDIANLKAESSKLNIIAQETNTIKLNASKTDTGTNVSADVKIKSSTDNIILTDGNGLYADVKLDYNKAENSIALIVNGSEKNKFTMSDHSLVQEGHYDSNTQSIVLTIVKDGGETQQISIPVGDIINEWTVDNGTNNPISLSKTTGLDNIDVLKAELEISTEAHNAILNNNGTLYVSNRAEDLTASWGGDEITLQKAIENLKTETDKVGDLVSNVDELKSDMTQAKNDITVLQGKVNTLEAKVEQNTQNISQNTGAITNLTTQVTDLGEKVTNLSNQFTDLSNQVDSYENRITKLEGDLINVNNTIDTINQTINQIKEQIGEPEEGQPNIYERLKKIENIVNNLIDFGVYGNI